MVDEILNFNEQIQTAAPQDTRLKHEGTVISASVPVVKNSAWDLVSQGEGSG